jgi:hypothetical protein
MPLPEPGLAEAELLEARLLGVQTSVAGRAGMAVSARVVAALAEAPAPPLALLLPAAEVPALAPPAVGLTVGLVMPTWSAGNGTLTFSGGEADDADE